MLQPICSTLLTHRNDPVKLTKLLIELKHVLLNMQPAGVQSCVDYVIFPLQVMLDAIAATRGRGSGNAGENNLKLSSSSSSAATNATHTSTPPTTAAFPALKSDKTAEAALSALLTLLQRGKQCSNGDQLLSLLHRLCEILALPRSRREPPLAAKAATIVISEEIRLESLKIVVAALDNVPSDDTLQSALREESAAPLIGHLGSVLVKAAAAELDAGTSSGGGGGTGMTGSKVIRIEALKALKMLIHAVNDAEALSFFLPGLVTGLARALLVAGGGGGGGGGGGNRLRSQGPAASGAAIVEVLQGLTCLLQATLGNECLADFLLHNQGSNQDFHSAAAGAVLVGEVGGQGSSQHWENLSGDAALVELFNLSQKGRFTEEEEEEKLPEPENATKTTTSTLTASRQQLLPPPLTTAPHQPGEAPKLRVDRTEEWVRASATRIEDMLGTVLPPLASDPRPEVREALVHGEKERRD
jgi:TELO2-interacting protein 1